jgi:DNA polymerase-1
MDNQAGVGCKRLTPAYFNLKGGMIMNTLLVDGNNLVYRNAVVMSNLTTKDGFPTGGIFGVLNGISHSLKEVSKICGEDISECITVFDGGRSKRRLEMYPEYKGTRKTDSERTEEEKTFYHGLIDQANILVEKLPDVGIKTLKVMGWEADDLIYGLIKQSDEVRDDVENKFIIMSTDEDFLQLISENVSVYSPIKGIYYTYDNFEELFGCKPENFISYKILKGDSSDNISGINGIGDKTGKKLVNEYGGLVGILNPANRAQLMKSKITQRIFTPEGLATIDRNNKLINLKEFVDYSTVEDELNEVLYVSPSISEKAAKEFLMKYQLSSILVKFAEWLRPYKELVEAYYESE